MAPIPVKKHRAKPLPEKEVWNSLKNAIAGSSGFQRWLLEHQEIVKQLRLEQQVQKYLRETLETLAY